MDFEGSSPYSKDPAPALISPYQIPRSLGHGLILWQNYNFICGSVWVRNLVSNIKGETQTEGV
jgi:hypothetical protein